MSLPMPCRQCGRPGKALCDACAALREAQRPARQARGYDAEYDRNRRLIVSEVLRNYEAVCCICGRGFLGCRPDQITAEHLVPIRRGGTSALGNLRPAHARCNYSWAKKVTT